MNEEEIEKRLGTAPGATLTALVALAEKTAPEAPWGAFKLLWLSLPWLEPGTSAADLWPGTPRNVHPFAETGGEFHHFGFLMDRDVPTDERPIVYVIPDDDADATEIVAPNLRDFLGLVAVSFAEVVSRKATDADWIGSRTRWYGDNPARLEEMARLSDLLCSIPGVVRPPSPSEVANAYPDQVFRLVFDGVEDDGPEEVRAADFKNGMGDARQATTLAHRALEEQRFDEAILHARCGIQHPAYSPRCLYVLATTYQRAGRKGAAKRTTETLLHAWLDPSPVAPPGIHPRTAIDRDELISLLEIVEGAHAGPLVERVRSAPELEQSSDDFL